MPDLLREKLKQLRVEGLLVGALRFDEPLARHVSCHIGGPAWCWAEVESLSDLACLLDFCKRHALEWTVVGAGSNLLVSDEGFSGVVLHLGSGFRKWSFDQDAMRFTAGAAVPLSRIVQEAFHFGVSGMELAVGVPGSLGGALRMKTDATQEWLGTSVLSITCYKPGCGLVFHRGKQVQWSRRFSSLPHDEIVVECELSVKPGDGALIRAKMEESLAYRKASQPFGMPSCGSIFRDLKDTSASQLIEAVGLKGACAGDAQISHKHANFIVNKGEARAIDVLALMHEAQSRVDKVYGIVLKPKVCFLGFSR